MNTQEDMQRVLDAIENIHQNLEGEQNVENLSLAQAIWKLQLVRRQLDNISYNMRQRYPKESSK